jgi:ribonuclease E
MESNHPEHAAMNEFDPQEKERLENWKALQIALGLVPEETPVPVNEVAATKPEPKSKPAEPPPATTVDAHDAAPEEEIVSGPAVEEFAAAEPAATPADAAQEVEAPEEIPEEPSEEPAPPGEKRRRRRRRRRRRGGGDAPEGAPAEAGAPPSNGQPTEEPAAEDAETFEEGDEEGEDDEEEIEPLSIPDWNVPTWQELIASLYRPER